jgi:hypothetical protein
MRLLRNRFIARYGDGEVTLYNDTALDGWKVVYRFFDAAVWDFHIDSVDSVRMGNCLDPRAEKSHTAQREQGIHHRARPYVMCDVRYFGDRWLGEPVMSLEIDLRPPNMCHPAR